MAFDRLDRNKDQRLSREEFKETLSTVFEGFVGGSSREQEDDDDQNDMDHPNDNAKRKPSAMEWIRSKLVDGLLRMVMRPEQDIVWSTLSNSTTTSLPDAQGERLPLARPSHRV